MLIPARGKARHPRWQAYLRQYKPQTLVVWGVHDPIFDVNGIADFQAVVPAAKVRLYESGHFALQEDADDIARQIIDTFGR